MAYLVRNLNAIIPFLIRIYNCTFYGIWIEKCVIFYFDNINTFYVMKLMYNVQSVRFIDK